MQRFDGASSCVTADDLKMAENVAVKLRRLLLVKSEPGPARAAIQSSATFRPSSTTTSLICG